MKFLEVASLASLVGGRTVAVVGRAGYLATSGQGAAIDAADVVVRVNWRLPIAPELVAHVGKRTDALYVRHSARVAYSIAFDTVPVFGVNTKLRRKLAGREHASHRPTTGVVCIHELLLEGASEVRLFGLDCYTSPTYADNGAPKANFADYAAGKTGWRHSIHQERRILAALIKDPRVIADRALKSALGAV